MARIHHVALALAALAFGCGDKQGSGDKHTAPAAGAEKSGTAKGAPADSPDKPGPDKSPDTSANKSAAGTPTCDCRMLSEYSVDDIEQGKFEELCEEDKLITGNRCGQYDEMRNCIYAVHGYKFKKQAWRDTFGKRDWYKARDDFKESDLSQLEIANVRALKERKAACEKKKGVKVSASDIESITSWFKNRNKRPAPLVIHEEMDELVSIPKC